MSLEIVILSAGKGKRMHSDLPKVLHKVAGKSMLRHVIDTSLTLDPLKIHVVVGHGGEIVRQSLTSLPQEIFSKINIVEQKEQLGTGHAVNTAMPCVQKDSNVVVLYGDTPLTPTDDLKALLKACPKDGMSLLTAIADNPFGYGRIVRNNDGLIEKIVEEKDANAQEKLINEVNTGMMAAPACVFNEYLPKLNNENAQGEYYLTDLVALLRADGKEVNPVKAPEFSVLCGVNNKVQLSFIERLYQERAAKTLLEEGVTLADPKRFDLRGTLTHGKDVFIDVNVIIEGNVILGNNVIIGAGCVLKDVSIGDDSIISPYTVMEKSKLMRHTTIGPFARLRPGNVLEDEVHVGNFVEVKNSHIGFGTKAGHLSYLGDSDIGTDVNIGAGTITCNYDGANKHRTAIEDEVFVGSDTQLVAPVTVRKGATIGAGTTVTKEVPEKALVITRVRPIYFKNYQRPVKNKK